MSLSSSVIELGIGVAAGGTLQGISEVFKLLRGGLNVLGSQAAAANRDSLAAARLQNDSANDAGRRSSVWLRGSLGLIVIVSGFLLVHLNGWLDVKTSLTYAKEPFLDLFGFLKIGGGMGVKVLEGVVLIPEFGSVITTVIGFVFGVGAVKTR